MLAARATLFACLCCVCILSPGFSGEARAAAADRLAGTWAIDVPATFELMEKNGKTASPEHRARWEEEMKTITFSFDLAAKTLSVRESDYEPEVMHIDTIKELSENTLELFIEENSMPREFAFLPDGRLRINEAVLVKIR